MPTLTITETSFQTACAECADALAASEFATARTKYAVAEAINAGLLARLTVGSVDKTRRERLVGLKEAIEFVSNQSTGRSDNRRLIRTKMGF